MSLAAISNRNWDNWSVNIQNLDERMKRMMLATMAKIAVLAVMDSTFYSFDGNLYKQSEGAGIGLRASACMAKILMSVIDRQWATVQLSWSLIVTIYMRYIDDLRIYIYPITAGLSWTEYGWEYNSDTIDERTPRLERSRQEIAKSLNAVVDLITFTTESEQDFSNNFLATLDFQTRVNEDGSVKYKFYTKPMENNITLQYDTALPQNTDTKDDELQQ